jgi:hypothetical protein
LEKNHQKNGPPHESFDQCTERENGLKLPAHGSQIWEVDRAGDHSIDRLEQ